MKKLIIISSPIFVRNYIATGAFKNIIDKDTFFACSSELSDEDKESVIMQGNFAGEINEGNINTSMFLFFSLLLMFSNRNVNKGFYLYFKKTLFIGMGPRYIFKRKTGE